MQVLRSVEDAQAACRALARRGSIGLVPTMGALHAGHLSLVQRARAENQAVVVTIFVNPLQFGPHEDFAAYPRHEEADAALLAGAGADLLLLLPVSGMYPPGFATRITQDQLTTVLEGAARPGHFDGVLTVVAKLLLIVQPDRSYFGQKDFQQTVVVRRLVADLLLPGEVVVCPICRDVDGLALSSRNVYLSADDRQRGLSLVQGLVAAEQAFEQGETRAEALEALLHAHLAERIGQPADYAALVRPADMSRPTRASAGDVLVVAARVGRTRLLDNHALGAKLGPFSA
jgi:pantoate--beta-alanine ligase